MKKTTIRTVGFIGVLVLAATTGQSQEFIPDPDKTINDYISLGEFNEAGNAEVLKMECSKLKQLEAAHGIPSGASRTPLWIFIWWKCGSAF